MLIITRHITISDDEVDITAVRAGGAGGQHVNKVATAAHLRFDITASALPDGIKQRLLHRHDRRITRDGIAIIKAQRYRSHEKNRADALERLRRLILSAMSAPGRRKPTRPTAASRRKRVDSKVRRGRIKAMRRKVET